MPYVKVHVSKYAETGGNLPAFGKELQVIVAEELNVPGLEEAWVKPDNIRVEFIPNGEFDQGYLPVDIRIEAQFFADRAKNRLERKDNITRRVGECKYLPRDRRSTAPKERGSVDLTLTNMSYGTF